MAGLCAELAFVLEPYFAGTCLVGPRAKPLIFIHSHFLELVPVFFSCAYRHYCSRKDCVDTRCATAVSSQLIQMAPTSVFVLYTHIRKVDWIATQLLQSLEPRYTQFGWEVKDYVGLREDPMEAWTSRVLSTNPEAQLSEFALIKVTFTAVGFMTYATECCSFNKPRLHKVIYYDDVKEYGAWRYYGGIPLRATDTDTSDLLVHVEPFNFVPWCPDNELEWNCEWVNRPEFVFFFCMLVLFAA